MTENKTSLTAEEKLIEIQRILDVDKETTATFYGLARLGIIGQEVFREIAFTEGATLDAIERVVNQA